MGWTAKALATAIQDEFGELGDLARGTVQRLVEDYRKTIPPMELSAACPTSVVGRNATRKVAEGLNELKELERLYSMQMERIEIDFTNEKTIKKLFPNTGREVFVAMKLLKQSADLKMDLGLAKRQLGTVELTGEKAVVIGERYGEEAAKVLTDPESGRKVLQLAQRLAQLGLNANVDSVIDPTKVIDVASEENVSIGGVEKDPHVGLDPEEVKQLAEQGRRSRWSD